MTITNILDRITFYTSLDTNIFPNTDRLLAINKWYDNLHSIILESQDEWDFDDSNHTDLPIAKTDLTVNVGTYAFPPTIYKLNKLEVNYGSGLVKANPIDLIETGLSDDEIEARASVDNPYYRVFNGSFQLYPVPTATTANGLQIFYDREVDLFTTADITTGTKKPGLDRLWHDYIAIGASLDAGVKFMLNNKADLKALLDDMETRIRKYYGNRQKDRKYQITNLIEDYE